MSARSYLKGGLLLTGGSVVSAACSFVRNVIIARLISLEDNGIASTFALTMTLIEMASNLAIDRLIVQAKDGDAPRLVATGHAFQVLRGACSAVVLFAVASPVARLFDVPEAAWAFELIALVPLIRAFAHLDVAQQQREMRFGGAAWIDAGPQLLVTLLAAPVALWLEDFRVMLVCIFVQVTAAVVVSHWVAERPYRWAWDREHLRRMVAFGWPLLFNGFLMFAIFQGDKTIVGIAKGMEDLGWYNTAFTLALTPSLLVVKILAPFMMPLLARVQDDREQFARRATLTVQLCTIAGALVGLGFVLAGPALLLTVYGQKFAPGVAVIGWFGIMQAARIAKSGPAIVAMSQGETTNPLIANLVRCLGIVLAVVAVALGEDLITVALCGMVGEALAALTAILLLRRRPGVPVRGMLTCVAAVTLALGLSQWIALMWFRGSAALIEIPVGTLLALALTAVLGAAFPQVIGLVRRVVADSRTPRAVLDVPVPGPTEGESP